MHRIVILFFLIVSSLGIAQSNILSGQIINADNKKPLDNAHILNLNTVEGAVSTKEGMFHIIAKASDTILISYVGFESIKLKVTNDLLKVNELEIALNEKPQEIKEVVISSTKLIGVLEVDVKMVPQEKFTRVKLNGIPQTYEIGNPKKSSSLLSKIFNPVESIYKLFGKKPNQLKKLKKLKKEEDLRKILAGKFDREVMMEYLQMDKQELSKLLSDCNYSEHFIQKASDLQLIEAILNCYENFKAVKKGKIDRNRIPEKK